MPPPPGYPQQPYAPAPEAKKTNGIAIASLICGVLSCIPVINLAAIVLGIIGIRKSSKPQGSGKGMAIAGLILGVIGVLGWAGCGVTSYMVYRSSAEPRAFATAFAQDLADGKVDAAAAKCAPSVSKDSLTEASSSLQALGPMTSTFMMGVQGEWKNGQQNWEIGGALSFGQTAKKYQVTLQKQGDTYKVVKFSID